MIPGKSYNPATKTSRRPTPEVFAHLRRWIKPVVQDIQITNISEMTNINQQLEQSANLFVSNIISRVIAQIIGKYGDGFVTIEGTAGGALHVAEQAVITTKKAVINIEGAATHEIVAAVAGKKISVRSYAFTVAGDTNITWLSEAAAISGPMDFGGTDEPRGISHSPGNYPLETAVGAALKITSSAAVLISGHLTYTED